MVYRANKWSTYSKVVHGYIHVLDVRYLCVLTRRASEGAITWGGESKVTFSLTTHSTSRILIHMHYMYFLEEFLPVRGNGGQYRGWIWVFLDLSSRALFTYLIPWFRFQSISYMHCIKYSLSGCSPVGRPEHRPLLVQDGPEKTAFVWRTICKKNQVQLIY